MLRENYNHFHERCNQSQFTTWRGSCLSKNYKMELICDGLNTHLNWKLLIFWPLPLTTNLNINVTPVQKC